MAVGEVAEGAQKLVIIVHIVDAKILGQSGFQLRPQGLIVFIPQPKDGHALVFERHGEAVIIGRKMWRQEDEVQKGLQGVKLIKYTKTFRHCEERSLRRRCFSARSAAWRRGDTISQVR